MLRGLYNRDCRVGKGCQAGGLEDVDVERVGGALC